MGDEVGVSENNVVPEQVVPVKSSKKWIWISVIGVVVVLLIVGGMIFLGGGKSSELGDFHIATILCQEECPLEEVVINYTDDEEYIGNQKELDYYGGAESYYSTSNQEYASCAAECMHESADKYYEGDINRETEFSQKTNWDVAVAICTGEYFTLEEIKTCSENHLKKFYSEEKIEEIRNEANL